MGIRVAKLDMGYDGINNWAVYQSVTDSLFRPMFFEELTARLYAYHYATLRNLSHDDWTNETALSGTMTTFIRNLYGEEPTDNEKYDEVLFEIQFKESRKNSTYSKTLDRLHEVFQVWRLNQNSKPEFLLVKEVEEE